MQVLRWIFSDRFDALYSDSCRMVGRPAIFRYIHQISDECYHDHEGLLVRDPPEQPLVVGLRHDLDVRIAELTAAHELAHERLIVLGYPLVYADLDMIAPLASAYSSVLSDPTIDRYLLTSGYDVRRLWLRDMDRLKQRPRHWSVRIPFPDPEEEVEFLRWLRLSLAPSSVNLGELECARSEGASKLVKSFRTRVRELHYETANGQRAAIEFLLQHSSARQLLHVFSPVAVNTYS